MVTKELALAEKDEDKIVHVALCYNPFDVSDPIREELVYQEGKVLTHYIEGLPDSCEWKVGLNGIPIEEGARNLTVVKENDIISIVAVPQGGDIFRMLAQLAVAIAAVVALVVLTPIIGPVWAAVVAATIATVGMFLVNVLIPPKGLKQSKDEGTNYGYDGARNTAREGIPLPVVYGKFWVGGNYTDLFSEMSGDNQYLYGRITLSDGQIDGLFDQPYLGELPIRDYQDVQWGFTSGSASEPINPRFNKAKSHFQRQDELETGEWVEYTTTGPVDQFQLNFTLPQGLIHFQKDGDRKNATVTLEIQYAPFGTTSWVAPGTTPGVGGVTNPIGGGGGGIINNQPGSVFNLQIQGATQTTLTPEAITYDVQYSPTGADTWTTAKTVTDTNDSFTRQALYSDTERYNIALSNTTQNQSYYPVRNVNLELAEGSYDFRTVVTSGTAAANFIGGTVQPTQVVGSTGSTTWTITQRTSKVLRRSYTSPTLAHARYHIRVRRTNANEDPSNDRTYDDIFLNDVAEIVHSKVAQRNIATGWFVARMTDQLQGVPQITWPVKGVKVDIYDVNGNVTATQWSDNPADIILDMLISEKRGPLRGKMSIDWPAFVEWRQHCTDEGLKFNGVFDTMETLWDQMTEVFRIGRAIPIRVGTKLSVAIDRPSLPVMLFGPGNIIKDSFNIHYLPLQDRATEFEVSYYDITDRNKKKTIRIADPDAAQTGQIPKMAQYDLFGIDNFEQAQKEVWYQLYNNRLIRRVITFDAPIESIGLQIGDVAYIQHDLMEWGTAGRVKSAASSTVVTLDKEVTIEAAKTYKLLLIHDKIAKTTGNIALVIGTTYNLSGMSTTSPTVDTLKRIQTDTGDEAAVLDVTYTGLNSATITLDRNVTGTTFTIWDVDVIEERTVTTGEGTTDTVTVASAFSDVPSTYCNYMFGESSVVKRPYRLTSITGDAIDRRTLSFGEYNEFIYSPPEQEIPSPTQQPPKVPEHVYGLAINVSPIRGPGGQATAIVNWLSDNVFRYAGADIYISRDNDDYTFFQTVLNTNQVMIYANDGEYLSVKVVAFNDSQIRANINTAPHVEVQVNTAAATLEEPTDVAWTLQRIGFMAEGYVSWVLGVPTGTIPNVSLIHRVQIKYDGTDEWLDKGTTNELQMELHDVPAGDHILRVRAENATGAISDWVSLIFNIVPPALTAPTFVVNGSALDHDINTDGSVNLNVEWLWDGDESDIDGFQIIVFQNGSNVEYTLGNSPGQETVYTTASDKRIQWFYGVPADKWYTIYVRAFRLVHPSFAAGGILYSVANKPSLVNEDPYQPSSNVAFGGDVTGTIGGIPIDDFLNGLGDTDPPNTPSGLELSSSTEVAANGEKWTKLLAEWTPASDEDLRGYVLAIKEEDGTYIEYVVDKGITAFFWSVLPSTQYTVKIASYDTSNNRSNFSAEVVHVTVADTIAPAAPTGLTGTAAITSIFLAWVNPSDADVVNTEVWENDVDDSSTATKIATVNAIPSGPGRFTRSGLVTGTTKFYWVKARDRSGNTSVFSTGTSVTTAQVGTGDIAAFSITAALIAAGTITADKILAGTITGDKISTGTSLPGSITVGSTGVTLETIADGGGSVNSGTTTILPGKILISGSTTLADWRYGGDLTLLDGGNIAANTISANKIYIGSRGLNIIGLAFEANRQITGSSTVHNDYVAWSAGSISYVDDTGLAVTVNISASFTQYTTNLIYIYWTKGATTLSATTVSGTAYGPNNVVLATYNGDVNLVATYGRTIIDGSLITTGTINADRIKAGTVIADTVLVGTVPVGNIADWADVTDATYIDGGKIFTGSITATQLSTSELITDSAQIGTATITTLKIAGNAIVVPVVTEGSDVFLSSTSNVDVLTTGTITVGDAVDGKAFITIYGWLDIGTTVDAGAAIDLFTNVNGAGFSLKKTIKVGCRTNNGDTYSFMPFSSSFSVSNVQTLIVKIAARQIAMPSSSPRSSTLRDPTIVIQGAKR